MAKETAVKPQDDVEVSMWNKMYPDGEVVKVHRALADKLIKSGKAAKKGEKPQWKLNEEKAAAAAAKEPAK